MITPGLELQPIPEYRFPAHGTLVLKSMCLPHSEGATDTSTEMGGRMPDTVDYQMKELSDGNAQRRKSGAEKGGFWCALSQFRIHGVERGADIQKWFLLNRTPNMKRGALPSP